jgi:PleD family two-component response regulator
LKFFADNLQMDKKQLLRQLQKMQKAISKAIVAIGDSADEVNESEAFQIGTCLYCKKPIYAGQRTTREVHRTCYNKLQGKVRSNKTSLEKLEQEGKLGPRGKPGPKESSFDEHVTELKSRQVED